MEIVLQLGKQKFSFDREATAALYRNTLAIPGSDSCSCTACKNFALQRDTVFPKDFVGLLTELGIDPRKELEAFDDDFDLQASLHTYGGWFVFVGQLLEGHNLRPADAAQSFDFWITHSFPSASFPAGQKVCAVQFLIKVPWLLPESL